MILVSGYNVGFIVGPILAGVVNTHLGWKWNFYINGCLTFAITILWVFLIKDTPQENASISPEELQFILNNIIVEEPNETAPKFPPYQKIVQSIKVWALVRVHDRQQDSLFMIQYISGGVYFH